MSQQEPEPSQIAQVYEFAKKLNQGHNLFFNKLPGLHWFFFCLGLVLCALSALRNDIPDLISSMAITLLSCPLPPFRGFPGLIRYTAIALLILKLG